MPDTPLTEAELKTLEEDFPLTPSIRRLIEEVRRLRTVMRKEDPNYRACEPPWLKRVREREGKNAKD